MKFLIPFATLALASVHADEAVLDAWLKRQPSIRSLEADFTQERKLPALKNPVTTPGKLSMSKPNKIRWQLGEPAETIAVSDGVALTLIDVSKKIARSTGLDSPQAARFSLLTGKVFQSPEDFRTAFDIIDARVDSGIHQFTLKAKDRRVRSQIPWIFLNIDPVKNELRALEMELQDKSRIRSVFRNVRLNAKTPDALFKPDLSGYTVK